MTLPFGLLQSKSFVYSPDDPPSAPPEKKDEKKEEKKDENPPEEKKDEKTLTLTEKELSDRIESAVKDRVERAKKAQEKDAEKIRNEEREKALLEQKEFEKVAADRGIRITELETTIAKIEPELEDLKKKFSKYEKAISSYLETQRKDLPPHVLKLLDKLDPVDQLEYIAENAADLRAAPKKPVPETPNPDVADMTEELRKNAQNAAADFARRSF